MKDEFIKVFNENIKRAGAPELLAWLERCDFFAAPASSKYHCNHEGGLCEHSLNVYKRLDCNDPEKRAICGLLHDVCKANFYKLSTRNVKNEETGAWEKVPFYMVDEKFTFGHGEKSVFLIERFMRLEIDEAVAIRYHMGDYADQGTPKAFSKYPLALMLHIADLQATFMDEKEAPQ